MILVRLDLQLVSIFVDVCVIVLSVGFIVIGFVVVVGDDDVVCGVLLWFVGNVGVRYLQVNIVVVRISILIMLEIK